MEGENGGYEWRMRIEDVRGGKRKEEEDGDNVYAGWTFANMYVRTYVHMYTDKIHLYVHLYICAWLCVVRGPSVRPLTIEHNSGVAVNASHHITDLHPVRLVGVKVTVTTVTGVSETHSGRGHTYIPHTIPHYCNTVCTTPMYVCMYIIITILYVHVCTV